MKTVHRMGENMNKQCNQQGINLQNTNSSCSSVSGKKKSQTIGTLFFTKEARIYNEAKTASSINGAGKTGQPHVKE